MRGAAPEGVADGVLIGQESERWRRCIGRRKARFLRAKNLEPFIFNDLVESTVLLEFVPFKGLGYQGRAFGYKAKLLPGVCWVYQDALVAGKLTSQ